MSDLVAGLALLAAMGLPGVAVLRRATSYLDPLEQIAYGFPFGVVVSTLVLLGLAIVFDFSVALIAAVAVTSAVITGLLWREQSFQAVLAIISRPRRPDPFAGRLAAVSRATIPWLPVLVLGGFALRWAILWSDALTYQPDGLWAGHVNIWGDWAAHLGDVTSFAYGNNFPPEYPRLLGHPFAYHYLTSLTAAAMVKPGMAPTTALPLQSLVFSVLLALGLYAFARRLTRDRNAAALAVLLFLLGGGLGWLLTAEDIVRTRDPLGVLLHSPWDQIRQQDANFRWQNVYFSLIAPQRPYLYGLPLALLILTLLLGAVRTRQRRLFIAAGLVAGLLPLAHLGTLLALALITPFLFLLFPSRGWILFFGVWIAVAVPQLYFQQGGTPPAAGALRLQIGWIAPPDPWVWFWIKNLGLFLPLLILALTRRDLIAPVPRRFLWACMPSFVMANLVVFQPWDWDNTKILVYWFLASSILAAALLAGIWRRQRSHPIRSLVVGLVAIMMLPGLLVNLQQFAGLDRHRLLTAEELRVAEVVREETAPSTVFATATQHNHPIPVLTGRRVVMGYPGWLWSYGFDYSEQWRDLQDIFSYNPNAPALLRKYGVDYVVIGPDERQEFNAKAEAFRERYPSIITTPRYEVFDVRAN